MEASASMDEAHDALEREACDAWDSFGLGRHTAVHAVQCRPVLAMLLESRGVAMPARRAAEAITFAVQEGQRNWTRHAFASWFCHLHYQQPQLQLETAEPRRGGKLRGGDGNRNQRRAQPRSPPQVGPTSPASREQSPPRQRSPVPVQTGAEEWALEALQHARSAVEREQSVEARAERARELAALALDEEELVALASTNLEDERREWALNDEARREQIRADGRAREREQARALESEAEAAAEATAEAAAEGRRHARAVRERAAAAARASVGVFDAASWERREAWKQPYWQGLQQALRRAEAAAEAAAASVVAPILQHASAVESERRVGHEMAFKQSVELELSA